MNEGKMKQLVKTKAKETGLPPQQLYGLFAMEQLLIKLNDSPYKDHLILKGGYVLATTLGLDRRATRDLDTTVRGFHLDKEKMEEIADFITQSNQKASQFELVGIKETREAFDYNGYELKLLYINGKARFPISVDFTTGEDLLDVEELEVIPSLFDTSVELTFPRYPLEQIIADKWYTTLAYGKEGDTNSRMKDLYDLHVLSKSYDTIDYSYVVEAVKKTMTQKNNHITPDEYDSIINFLQSSEQQKLTWKNYQRLYPFARELQFNDVMESVKWISNQLEASLGK
ncbi:nucleotidyl transferase AbiEii/AbiGii toxin family protein [Alkalibacterium olivapovliticus]|uniref:Nucleotidyltransferase AbiEii toxin of type IV toxin-antitoxin system n=1 Tax=Alkalibacterium olivapovliticus TaxID=99907 RepID=A0A2T0VT24_9LACT|nr:nucleotidyl transferase AbiEii/AbiGii toxin family protein [Alkalibacterium olivapovliticus]PRY73917.1 nucleotidyltransferase AbiEii toxin of type IV toxin-antitoxin system [Alkalibacterium olivapovliticus]